MQYSVDKTVHKHIKDHLDNITINDRPILIVFKGFTLSFYENITFEKLLYISLNTNLIELDNSKATLLPEFFQRIDRLKVDNIFWCTFEEYLILGEDILKLYFTTTILENNIFHKTFPCIYEIPESHRLKETYFDEEVVDIESEEDPVYEVFRKYYGDLKFIGSECYIVYTDDIEEVAGLYPIPSFQLQEQKVSGFNNAILELSEEEDELLKLTGKLLSEKFSEKEIRISYTGDIDNFPYRYRERLLILQNLFRKFNFILVTKITETCEVNEEQYLRLLNNYWGFKSFRNLRMYKDIHDPDFKKETIEIPQSLIISNIVEQAELANAGETYKDIFLTSPTGAGKSLMFQIPAIYLAEKYNLMTIVISPLIGLMTDQVQGLVNRNVDMSATINSQITPVQKMDIMEQIKNGEISILYISPETLLSRADIRELIGERKVGLFVIDEAHIVTTWGKAFRSDYWYLGNYLQRLRNEIHFPIATFTATAIYGGLEDMYAETRDSLNLINPISYFGYVKRDDIEVRLKKKEQTKDRFNEYLEEKFKILTFRLEKFLKQKQKTLVYFPTISLILQFKEFVIMYGSDILIKHLSLYYGSLEKEPKNANYLRFKNGESLIMLATKAFGMGIDIPDITNVYHFAPTGNVCDYVQEVGRAARALEQGYSYFDFLPKDFIHVNRLHGISTLRKNQLIQVMHKILQLLEAKNNRRNMRNLLINGEEFRYIFQQGNIESTDDIDNKLKTALLIIEKDFKAKLGYSPIIARPRSVFAKEYFMIKEDFNFKKWPKFEKYFRMAKQGGKEFFGNIYACDMKGIWEEHFRSLSFPQFKFKFHSNDEELGLDFLDNLLSVLQIQVSLKLLDQNNFFAELHQKLDHIATIIGSYAKDRRYFAIEDFAENLQKLIGGDKYYIENLASILIYSARNYDRIMRKYSNFYNRFITYNEGRNRYCFQNSGYAGFIDWIRNETRQLLNHTNCIEKGTQTSYEIFLPKRNREKIEKVFILLGILEALGLVLYNVQGGDNPEIFLRINSRLQIDRSLQSPHKYKNYILDNVYKRHKMSVSMLTYLFTNEVDNKTFWEYIEDYFLGKIPDEVSAEVDARDR
ncbi:MAG: DEAD/DEAH box helicase [Clostridiales bacterium]|nr:DEAD/DEAH box helicase [Clostridiales bacterium]MCF8021610.1 DEAD/DEAH box helicase [Clostridiales bacterium]